MKRMERLERAVGEIQRRLLDLGYPPSAELDLTRMDPISSEEFERRCAGRLNAMYGDESGVFELKTYPEEVEI